MRTSSPNDGTLFYNVHSASIGFYSSTSNDGTLSANNVWINLSNYNFGIESSSSTYPNEASSSNDGTLSANNIQIINSSTSYVISPSPILNDGGLTSTNRCIIDPGALNQFTVQLMDVSCYTRDSTEIFCLTGYFTLVSDPVYINGVISNTKVADSIQFVLSPKANQLYFLITFLFYL